MKQLFVRKWQFLKPEFHVSV